MPVRERRTSDICADFLLEKFSILPVIGGIYGFHTSVKWSAFSYSMKIIMYTIVSLTFVDLAYTSWLLFDNMAMFSFSFHLFLIGCNLCTASVSLTLKRQQLAEWFSFVCITPSMAEYQKIGKYFQDLEKQTDRRISRLMIMFLAAYGFCSLVAVTVPFVDSYLGYDELVKNVTGIYWKQLPFPIWFPFDAHSSTAAWMSCFLFEGFSSMLAVTIWTAAIMLCSFTFECLLNHTKLLIHTVERLDERTTAMFKEQYRSKPTKKFEKEYDDCYYKCIIQNVLHHLTIRKQLADIQAIANYCIAVPFFGGAMYLGLAGVNFMSHGDPRIGPKFLICNLAVTEIASILLLCIYGERFQQESERLFNSVLYTKWYKRSKKCRRALMILREGTFKPMKITAAKLIVPNMETLSNMVNSAYSIFNLSMASREDVN